MTYLITTHTRPLYLLLFPYSIYFYRTPLKFVNPFDTHKHSLRRKDTVKFFVLLEKYKVLPT